MRAVRHFVPNPRSSVQDLSALVRVHLLSQIDVMWRRDAPLFETDADVRRSTELVDLERLRLAGRLRFGYRVQASTVRMRAVRAALLGQAGSRSTYDRAAPDPLLNILMSAVEIALVVPAAVVLHGDRVIEAGRGDVAVVRRRRGGGPPLVAGEDRAARLRADPAAARPTRRGLCTRRRVRLPARRRGRSRRRRRPARSAPRTGGRRGERPDRAAGRESGASYHGGQGSGPRSYVAERPFPIVQL